MHSKKTRTHIGNNTHLFISEKLNLKVVGSNKAPVRVKSFEVTADNDNEIKAEKIVIGGDNDGYAVATKSCTIRRNNNGHVACKEIIIGYDNRGSLTGFRKTNITIGGTSEGEINLKGKQPKLNCSGRVTGKVTFDKHSFCEIDKNEVLMYRFDDDEFKLDVGQTMEHGDYIVTRKQDGGYELRKGDETIIQTGWYLDSDDDRFPISNQELPAISTRAFTSFQQETTCIMCSES